MNTSSEYIEFLTAKLLDGTISDDEYRQIESLVNSQPEFAKNLTELTRIEDLLKTLNRIKPTVTPGLLESVENSVCSMINVCAATSSGAVFAGKSLLNYVLGAAGITVVAGLSYWAATSYRQSPQNIAPPAAVGRQTISEASKPPILENNSRIEKNKIKIEQISEPYTKKDIVKVENKPAQNQSISEHTASSATKNDAEISAPVNAERLLKDIRTYSELYTHAVAANNQIDAAENAKNLGLLYGKLNDYEQARAYFKRSVTAAHSAGISEFEAEAYGQLGIMEVKSGDISAAKDYLNRAVRLLNETNVSSSKWQLQLDKLNNTK